MGTFVEFIESESFFPILILLLVLLMFIFASILMSGKKNQRKRIQERKKIKIDESAQVQLVQEHEIVNEPKKEQKLIEVETGSTEVNLFFEEEIPIESVDLAEVETTENNSLKENTLQVQADFVSEPINVKRAEISYADLSNTEVEVAPFVREKEDLNNQYKVTTTNALNESIRDEQLVNVELTNPIDKNNDIGEEIEVPHPSAQDESNEIPIISEAQQEVNDNAFGIKPDDNSDINENIQFENPKEYVSDKTEIIEFPDFDSISQEVDIEEKIIDAANKYIESIMNR